MPSTAAVARTAADQQSNTEGMAPVSVCENHGEGKNGKICSFYITVKQSGSKYQRRLKLCQACVDSMRMTFADQWSDGFILAKSHEAPTCVGCGEIVPGDQELVPLYATGYSRNDLRHDYSATYCDDCARSVISQFKLELATNGTS